MIPLKEALIRKNRQVNLDQDEIIDFIIKNYSLSGTPYISNLNWSDFNIYDVIKINNKHEVNIAFPDRTNEGSTVGEVTLMANNKNLQKLTNGKFVFGIIEGNFYCGGTNITSLEGAPKACYNFYCGGTDITSLKGIENMRCNIGDNSVYVPWSRTGAIYNSKRVGEINCSKCDKLKSLEGAPEFISADITGKRIQEEGKFNALTCKHCVNLTSLDGLTRYEVPAFIDLTGCRRLQSIDEIINYFETRDSNKFSDLKFYTKDSKYLIGAGYQFPAKFKKLIETL